MSLADRKKWDDKYADATYRRGDEPPALLPGVRRALPETGRVLDLACGEGQGLIYMADQGYRGVGVDISPIGLQKAAALAHAHGVSDRLSFVPWDLDEGVPPLKGRFDVILCIHFHAPALWPALRGVLADGGFIVVETLTTENVELGLPHPAARYLAAPGELLTYADGLRVRLFRETLVDGSVRAQLLAQDPGGAPPDLRR